VAGIASRVEVRNVEQNPGITFLAASVVDLDAVE